MGEIPPAPGGWWSLYYNKFWSRCKEGVNFFCPSFVFLPAWASLPSHTSFSAMPLRAPSIG